MGSDVGEGRGEVGGDGFPDDGLTVGGVPGGRSPVGDDGGGGRVVDRDLSDVPVSGGDGVVEGDGGVVSDVVVDPLDVIFRAMSEHNPSGWVGTIAKVAGFEVPGGVRGGVTDLATPSVRADRVYLLEDPDMVVHVEFQTVAGADFGLRMLDYYVRLARQYGVPVVQVVVAFTAEASARVPSEMMVGEHVARWVVLRPWEYDAEFFLGVLPALAVLARQEGSAEEFLEQMLAAAPTVGADSEEIEFMIALAEHRFSRAVVEVAMRSVDMTFTDVFAETLLGEALLERGRDEGREEGRVLLLVSMLESRFGAMTDSDKAALDGLSLEGHDRLAAAVHGFESIEDFREWLADNS